MKDSNIESKVVVITGASGGLGASTARLLAEHGATIVLGARRKDRIDQVVDIPNHASAIVTTDQVVN